MEGLQPPNNQALRLLIQKHLGLSSQTIYSKKRYIIANHHWLIWVLAADQGGTAMGPSKDNTVLQKLTKAPIDGKYLAKQYHTDLA